MTRQIFCQKLQREAEGLAQPPFPGELGTKIFENISAPAWQQWLAHQTILVNEYRLSMIDPKAREFLRKEMKKFLFEGGDGSKPAAYNPENP